MSTRSTITDASVDTLDDPFAHVDPPQGTPPPNVNPNSPHASPRAKAAEAKPPYASKPKPKARGRPRPPAGKPGRPSKDVLAARERKRLAAPGSTPAPMPEATSTDEDELEAFRSRMNGDG